MTREQKSTPERTPALWEPTEEMVAQTIAALKTTPDNLWEEFKVVEINVGNLMNEAGNKLRSKIQEINPELNLARVGFLTFRLREIVRKEAGLQDRDISKSS